MSASRLLAGGYSAGTPGDSFLWIAPRLGADGTKPAVILCHGATSTPSQFLSPGTFPNLTQKVTLPLAAAGYPIIAPLMGGDTWGNDTALGLISDAKTYAQANGAKSGKVILLGGSMGGGAAYAWARAHLSSVACLVGIQPVSDLQDFVTNNRQGLASSVNAAYGGAYSDGTYGAAHNPHVFASSLAGLPVQVWYATDDTTVIPSTVTDVTTAIGGVDLHTLTGGHSDAAIAGVSSSTLLAFLAAHS